MKSACTRPVTLFSADEADWAQPINNNIISGKPAFVTDGPFLVKDNGRLTMFWSSWHEGSYSVGTAESVTGKLRGPWVHAKEPLFSEDGGHGMVFTDKNKDSYFIMHYPNTNPLERPILHKLRVENGVYSLDK